MSKTLLPLREVKAALKSVKAESYARGVEAGRAEATRMLEFAVRLNGHGPRTLKAIMGDSGDNRPVRNADDRGGVGSRGCMSDADRADGADPIDDVHEQAPTPVEIATLAYLDALIEAKEHHPEGDGGTVAQYLRGLLDDPEQAAAVFAEVNGGKPAKLPVYDSKAFDASKHPRGDDGRFIGRESIHAAKSDPELAEKLRAKTTDPEERKKLDAALAGESDLGRTKAGLHKERVAATKAEKAERLQKVRTLAEEISMARRGGQEVPPEHFTELAEHLPHLTVDQLRSVRTSLAASFWGRTRRDEMVTALVRHAKVKAEQLRAEQAADDPLDFGMEAMSNTGGTGHADAGRSELNPWREFDKDKSYSEAQHGGRIEQRQKLMAELPASDKTSHGTPDVGSILKQRGTSEPKPEPSRQVAQDAPGRGERSPEPSIKQPHEMTADEYADANRGKFDTRSESMDRGKAKKEHARIVANRVLNGEPVSPDRIAEYPHLDIEKMQSLAGDAAAKLGEQKQVKQKLKDAQVARQKLMEEIKRGSQEAQAKHDAEALKETLGEYLDKRGISEGNKAKILTARQSARGYRVDPNTGATLEVPGGDSWYMPHYNAVKAAIAAGKPVPPEVLADYPDLQAKYGAKNAEPSTAANQQKPSYTTDKPEGGATVGASAQPAAKPASDSPVSQAPPASPPPPSPPVASGASSGEPSKPKLSVPTDGKGVPLGMSFEGESKKGSAFFRDKKTGKIMLRNAAGVMSPFTTIDKWESGTGDQSKSKALHTDAVPNEPTTSDQSKPTHPFPEVKAAVESGSEAAQSMIDKMTPQERTSLAAAHPYQYDTVHRLIDVANKKDAAAAEVAKGIPDHAAEVLRSHGIDPSSSSLHAKLDDREKTHVHRPYEVVLNRLSGANPDAMRMHADREEDPAIAAAYRRRAESVIQSGEAANAPAEYEANAGVGKGLRTVKTTWGELQAWRETKGRKHVVQNPVGSYDPETERRTFKVSKVGDHLAEGVVAAFRHVNGKNEYLVRPFTKAELREKALKEHAGKRKHLEARAAPYDDYNTTGYRTDEQLQSAQDALRHHDAEAEAIMAGNRPATKSFSALSWDGLKDELGVLEDAPPG